jgi:hypothetical protein
MPPSTWRANKRVTKFDDTRHKAGSLDGLHARADNFTRRGRDPEREKRSVKGTRIVSKDKSDRDRFNRRYNRQALSFASICTQPDKFYQNLAYNHLAPSSLQGIEIVPHVRFSKGDEYLKRWWSAAKKWNLLTGKLKSYQATKSSDDFSGTDLSHLVNERPTKKKDEEAREIPLDLLYEECAGTQARVICIGDVHGCIDEVCDLLRKVNYAPGDQVLFLGDLVAKGPSSVDVVRLAIDISALSVRGNHDHEVVRQGVTYRKRQGKYKVLSSRKAALESHEHLQIALKLSIKEFNWLAQLPYYIRSIDLGAVFVHAGFQGDVRLMDQDPWVMMTMRSLLPDGRVSARCIYKQPWADRWMGPLSVFFGHDAARGLQNHERAVGLDTGCVYGGRLTAIILPNKEIISVPARKTYQDYMYDSHSHISFCPSIPISHYIPLTYWFSSEIRRATKCTL